VEVVSPTVTHVDVTTPRATACCNRVELNGTSGSRRSSDVKMELTTDHMSTGQTICRKYFGILTFPDSQGSSGRRDPTLPSSTLL
jgi:hypothetical protein